MTPTPLTTLTPTERKQSRKPLNDWIKRQMTSERMTARQVYRKYEVARGKSTFRVLN